MGIQVSGPQGHSGCPSSLALLQIELLPMQKLVRSVVAEKLLIAQIDEHMAQQEGEEITGYRA